MKKLLLTVPFLFLSAQSQAQLTDIKDAPNFCTQVIQPAVGPNGQCKEFSTPCQVPEDWKAIPSCDLVEDENKKSISLEEKMKKNQRKFKGKVRKIRNQYSQGIRRVKKNTGIARRTRAYVNPSQKRSTKKYRTQSRRVLSSLGLQRRNELKLKGLTAKKTDRKIKERFTRPALSSRTNVKRTGKLKSTQKWKIEKKSHFKERNYGKNPYTLKSKYGKNQKKLRDESNKKIDTNKRKHNGFKIFRGERKLGNLEGEIQE